MIDGKLLVNEVQQCLFTLEAGKDILQFLAGRSAGGQYIMFHISFANPVFAKDDQPFYGIAQLADIAGPVDVFQAFQRAGGYGFCGDAVFLADLLHKVPGQGGNIIFAVI